MLTQARGEATELAAEWSPRAEAIYVFSGDGTYNEVINGLRADVPVGFVPGGGTSVLPRALGLPRDPARAAERIAHGAPRRISLGRINGRLFAFNAGIGFDAELVRRVDAMGRRADGKRPGDLAFSWTVRQGARRSPLPLRGGTRGRRARPGRVRADRELLALHLRRARSGCGSCPVHRSRAASTSSRPSRCDRGPCRDSPSQAFRGRPGAGDVLAATTSTGS